MKSDPFQTACRIAYTLRGAGYEAYLVGGSVRDRLLGFTPHEYDIVTSAIPEEIRALFPKTVPIGERFGVILVVEAGHLFEIATYRTESHYLDGRRPTRIDLTASAREDVQRRDFTINGLLMDPASGEIIDFVGGREDIRRRLIRTIGDPDARFNEDHLRMLRAIRFATTLGFDIDPATCDAIVRHAPLIANISMERVREELTKILTRGDSRRGMTLLSETGLLAIVLPEVKAMQHVAQPQTFHPEGDVWEHTLKMLEIFSQRTDTLRANVRLAWGILLHDVGKPVTRSENGIGIHFYGHARQGEHIARRILRRLRFSRAVIETVDALIREHMRFIHVMEMTPNHLTRFMRIPDFQLHLELHRLDCLASHGHLEGYDYCVRKLSEKTVAALHPAPLLTGHDLKALGFRPGALFSEILHAVESAQLDGHLHTKEEATSFVLDQWHDRVEGQTPDEGSDR